MFLGWHVDFSSIVRHSPIHEQWENARPLLGIRVDLVRDQIGLDRVQTYLVKDQVVLVCDQVNPSLLGKPRQYDVDSAMVLSWGYGQLGSGLGRLGQGPSRLDHGSSDLDQVQVDDVTYSCSQSSRWILWSCLKGLSTPWKEDIDTWPTVWVSDIDLRGARCPHHRHEYIP